MIKVLVTQKEGEHRIHVRGDGPEVRDVVLASEGLVSEHRLGVASGPEANLAELRAAWHNSRSAKAKEALSRLDRDVLPKHYLRHPDCPHRLAV